MPKIDNLEHIRYRFIFPSEAEKQGESIERAFAIFLEKGTNDLVQPVREDEPIPDWAKLNYCKCSTCPLSDKDYQFCPAARALVDVVEFFSDLPSFGEVEVVVETPLRTYSAKTSVQQGVRSLMGLIMPVSGCPVLSRLKPMTFLHLPFSSNDETTYRAVSMYLIGQYFSQRFGGEASFDLEGLQKIYKEIHRVNVDFINRLKGASSNDANLNSLVSLDIFTMAVPRSIDALLEVFLPLFLPPEDIDEDSSSCR